MHLIKLMFTLALAAALTGTAQAATDTDEERVAELVIANRILADQGVVDGFGHISVRSASNPDHYFMAVSRAPAIVTRSDIIEIDSRDGKPVKPETRDLYGERFIHGEIYKLRSDVQSVVHSHTAAILPFGLTKTPFRPLVHVAYFLGVDPVPVFEIRDVAGEDNKITVSTAPLGAGLARSLGQRSVVLMRGHGMTVVAGSIKDAVFRAIYTKVNAEVETASLQMGKPVFLNRFEVDRTERVVRQWEAWAAAYTAIDRR